jgi:hypothetical protein
MELLFELGIESAMRMREMYALDTAQVEVGRRTVFLDKTKNGSKRQVPLPVFSAHCPKYAKTNPFAYARSIVWFHRALPIRSGACGAAIVNPCRRACLSPCTRIELLLQIL